MNIWWIIGIIVLVLGMILSNILLLKHSAGNKFGSSLTDANRKTEQENEDSATD